MTKKEKKSLEKWVWQILSVRQRVMPSIKAAFTTTQEIPTLKQKNVSFRFFSFQVPPPPPPLKTLGGGVVWRVRAGNFCHCEHTPHPLATTHPIKFAAYNTIVDYWIGKLKTFYFDDYCLLVLAYYNKSLIFAYLYLNLYFLKNDNIIVVTA